ncbi:PREDICTED: acyl transferase 4 [Nicotiana attenuata]|uniref:3'-n-debenzoyl-2'-deoxytaxol n-benzoyltransferase n=1 Tax=Nicotiana attenuata TaxID=49451 RepID=A0A1J6IFV1_NICAT|nr:PREDICTED: acyl transferase 4 [Nicotiana attenuata]XP_019244860.1 PREDICTED: acyl transferase 4 [Nicotiana attenuata]OIT03933.1 3'-n-debenzoyl-2'-deoxytaxol n-benzoyltransferase [Nicotiana attenuata]
MIMDFLVTRRGGGGNLVTPSGQTPNGVLDLSVIDSLAVLRCNARTLHVFKGGDATLIRDAFSKALVPYYPLAGRLKMSVHSNNQLLQIDCSAQGIWFEEASADCTLYDVNYLDEPAALEDSTFDKLLPQLHSSSPHPIGHDTFMDPLVLVQVTEFKCGGFVMGLTFCHSICDGLGAAQFLKAVGEFARGVEKLSATPVWCREYLLPTPSAQKGLTASDHETKDNSSMSPPFIIPVPDQRLEHASFDIPMDEINQLKHNVMQDQLMDRQNAFCSSFEIIAATLWKQRSRAILDLTNDEMNSSSSSNSSFITTHNAGDDEVKLVFFANCRQLVPLPDGFYGNCFFPVTVKASNKIVAQASLAEVVKLIKDAKAKLPTEFSQWLNNKTYKSVNKDQNGNDQLNDPFAPGPGVGYDTLFISEWGRLGFNEVDYGWGKPVHVIPVQGSAVIPVGIVSKQPLPQNGTRIMTWCVHGQHLPSFLNMMNKGN